MSLLLDALKRAEQAKRAKAALDSAVVNAPLTAERASQSPPLALDDPVAEPRSPPPSRAEAAKKAGLGSTAFEQEFSLTDQTEFAPSAADSANLAGSTSTSSPPPRKSMAAGVAKLASNPAPNRDLAKGVFSAKQPAAYVETRSKPWLAPLIAVSIVLIGLAAWYIWNEVSRTLVSPLATTMTSVARTTLPPAARATGQPDTKLGATASDAEANMSPPPMLPPPLVKPRPPAMPLGGAQRNRAPQSERELLAQNLKRSPASKDAPIRLKLAQTVSPPALNGDLVSGYAALTAGDYASATRSYANAAKAEPFNIDAHLGLATATARAGNAGAAVGHYRQVLELDPRNSTALAGLLALNVAPGENLEVALKTALAKVGEADSTAAPLYFALGNVYAGEKRWTEAQQAFFEAYRLDSANADFAFNLAVSLDQLKQSRLALEYYQKALAADTAGRGAQFDRAILQQRIGELQTAVKKS